MSEDAPKFLSSATWVQTQLDMMWTVCHRLGYGVDFINPLVDRLCAEDGQFLGLTGEERRHRMNEILTEAGLPDVPE